MAIFRLWFWSLWSPSLHRAILKMKKTLKVYHWSWMNEWIMFLFILEKKKKKKQNFYIRNSIQSTINSFDLIIIYQSYDSITILSVIIIIIIKWKKHAIKCWLLENHMIFGFDNFQTSLISMNSKRHHHIKMIKFWYDIPIILSDIECRIWVFKISHLLPPWHN